MGWKTRLTFWLSLKRVTILSLIFCLSLENLLFNVVSVYAASSPWTQTDWSGGSGQTSWSDATKYDSASNVTTSTVGQATLTNTEELSNTGFESDLSSWSEVPSYTLNDQFTTDRAAGAVNGTSAEPTGGTRTVVDTNSKLSLASGVASFATGGAGAGDPGLWYSTQARGLGKILIGTITPANTSVRGNFGFDTNQAGSLGAGEYIAFDNTGAAILHVSGASFANVGTYSSGVAYSIATVLRTSGSYLFIKGGTFTNWTLLSVYGVGTTTPLFPGAVVQIGTTTVFTADNMRIPTATWVPTPLAYDTFTRSDGAVGSSETTGPDSQTTASLSWTGGAISSNKNVITPTLGNELIVNGGFDADTDWTKEADWSIAAGVATKAAGASSRNIYENVSAVNGGWYQVTFTISAWVAGLFRSLFGSTGAFGASRTANGTYMDTQRAVAGGLIGVNSNSLGDGAIDNVSAKALTLSSLFSTVPTSDSDVIADANVTMTAGTQAGLVLNLDSTSSPANFVIAYHDGTNVKLDKNVGGTYTNLISAVATYSAGATLRVIKDGTKYRVFYNNAAVGTEQTISDAGIINNTIHGLFSTYSGNSFDNFTLWARGTGAEYTDAPFEELTPTRDTGTKYAGAASAKLVAGGTDANYLQSVNVGDTNTYNLSAYAYTDGSAVTASDLSLYYDTATISTTYTSVGGGWYQLTGTVTGAASAKNYGVRVKAGKTVYTDNFSVNRYETSGTLTSSIFDSGFSGGAVWGTLTYSSTGSTVAVKARTSNSSSMSGATDFSACTAITYGADISSNTCVTDSHRYIQYQLALSTSDVLATPTFSDISIAFETFDSVGPVITLDSPGDNSYTNSERPTFKWKAATDAISSVADYDLIIDNPSNGSSEPSGDFTISDIPVSRTSDYETNKYIVHYDGFSDSDSDNNYISVYTKSSSDWGTSENDGKLREGRITWKVTATDSVGNSTEASRTLFVDRTNPNLEVSQINNAPFTSTSFATSDRTPTIFGKITDVLSGAENGQTSQTENGPKIASGPREVNIKLEKKSGLTYNLVSLYKINIDKPWYSCDGKEVTDNSKQKCDKYLPFAYTPESLEYGIYRFTLTGKDKADNSASQVQLTLNIGSYSQIATPQEEKSNPEITKPTEISKPNIIEKTAETAIETRNNFFAGLGTAIRNLITGIGRGIAFAFSQTAAALVLVTNGMGTIASRIAFAYGQAYNQIAQHAPGITKNILLATGRGITNIGQSINDIKKATGNGIANLAFAMGEKIDDISHGLGLRIIEIGYIFVPEPTTISSVKVAKSTPTTMTITWQTNHPASSKVNYGLTPDYGQDVQSDKRLTKHEVTVSNLKPGTTYYYEVMSQNRNYVYDANHTYTTPKLKD